MTDAVLIDLAVKVDPAIEVVFIDTGYHFPETLETVETVRRRYGLNLRIMTVRPPGRGALEGRPGELLLGGQGRPARPGPRRQGGLDERPAPRRGRHPRASAPIVARDLRGLVKVNPHRHLDRRRRRRLHRRPRRPGQPAAHAGLPVDRLHALHPARRPTARIPARAAGPAATRRSAACTWAEPGHDRGVLAAPALAVRRRRGSGRPTRLRPPQAGFHPSGSARGSVSGSAGRPSASSVWSLSNHSGPGHIQSSASDISAVRRAKPSGWW